MLPRAHARRDLSSQRRLIHRAGAAVGSFRGQLVVSAEVRSHVRSVPPPDRKNPATVLNAPELRGSLPPHQHERKTRAPVQSDLIVHFEQPTASPFFPGIRPCRKEEGRPCHHNGRKRRTGLPPPARPRPGRRFFSSGRCSINLRNACPSRARVRRMRRSTRRFTDLAGLSTFRTFGIDLYGIV